MIKLDLDVIYLTSNYNIGAQKLCKESNANSVKDIMEEEADSGNTKAANFEDDVLRDRNELIEAFRLGDAANRYQILSNLNPSDLKYFLKYLTNEDLAMGLRFFTKEKILELLKELPQESLFRILKEVFSIETMINLMPEDELNKFIDSSKIEKSMIMKHLDSLPPEALSQMIEAATGKPSQNKNPEEMIKTIGGFSPKVFKESLKSIDKEFKSVLIADMLKHDEGLVKEFSKDALTAPFKQLDKPEIIKAMESGMEQADLSDMIQELPDDLLAMVITQIDPSDFADVLIKQFQDILSEISLK